MCHSTSLHLTTLPEEQFQPICKGGKIQIRQSKKSPPDLHLLGFYMWEIVDFPLISGKCKWGIVCKWEIAKEVAQRHLLKHPHSLWDGVSLINCSTCNPAKSSPLNAFFCTSATCSCAEEPALRWKLLCCACSAPSAVLKPLTKDSSTKRIQAATTPVCNTCSYWKTTIKTEKDLSRKDVNVIQGVGKLWTAFSRALEPKGHSRGLLKFYFSEVAAVYIALDQALSSYI